MDINKIKKPIYTDDRSDSHPTRQRLQYLAKLNQNSANEQKVRENNNKQNKRLNHSNETIKKIRTYQKVIYDKDNNSRIKTYYREAPGEDSTNGVDPVGGFITEGTALSPLFKLAGTGLLYGAGKLGSNWARSKIISETMNKNLMGVNQYLNGTYGEATDYLFDKLHPELSKIESKDQYKQYLYRMMPTSSTDKIYYHGSNSNFSDGLNSATKGAGSGAPETGNEMYFAKQPATVLQYVDGINTGIKDTNGFGHWNKLWWQAKEMLGNGQKDGWKAKTITQLRQQIPNKRGVYDETTHHGKLLSQIKSYYGAQDMSDRDFAKNIFNIDLGKESFDDWVSKNKEQFEQIWKNRQFNNGVYPVRINTTRPYIESGKDTYYRDRGVFDSKHDAVLSNNAKNEFGSDVAIVFDPKNNVNFLGSKADQNSFINFVNGDNHKLMLGYHFLYGNK